MAAMLFPCNGLLLCCVNLPKVLGKKKKTNELWESKFLALTLKLNPEGTRGTNLAGNGVNLLVLTLASE